jgi:hypothetical protein
LAGIHFLNRIHSFSCFDCPSVIIAAAVGGRLFYGQRGGKI